MQMIDVMKRLAELDAQNPSIIKENASQLVTGKFYVVSRGDRAVAGPFDDEDEAENQKAKYSQGGRYDAAVAQWAGNNWNFDYMMEQGVAEGLQECGMMGSMSSQPHTPASINMTAASGEELSSMLKDIMTLAGKSEPMSVEPVKGADSVATVDMGMNDEPSVMRSMLDKLNPGDDEDEPEDEKPVEEYDNSPDVETQGYDSMVPSGNDLHKEKNQYPAAQRGDNAMSIEESLMNEWKKFVAEGSESEQEYHDRMHRLAAGYHGMDPQRRAKMEKIPGWKDQYDQALAYVEKHPKNDQQGVEEGIGFDSPEQEAAIRNRLRELEDTEDADDMYAIVADEFDMTEYELRLALSGEEPPPEAHLALPEQDNEGESDPLKNREKYAQQHGQGQVYKKTYPGNKTGMTQAYAYDIKRTGPKGQLPKEGVAEQLDILKLAGLK